jgi:hypothetical protein
MFSIVATRGLCNTVAELQEADRSDPASWSVVLDIAS